MNKLQKIRAKTRDVAFTFRMGAGFPGDVNRTHPFSVVPGLQNATGYLDAYGQAVLYDATTGKLRKVVAGDSAITKIDGVSVRAYPTQQTAASLLGAPATFGAATPPTAGIIDVLEDGFIMVQLPVGSTAPVKGAAVYVWFAVASGNHIQGGFEAAATGGSTATLTNARFTGGMDANLVAEIQVFRQ